MTMISKKTLILAKAETTYGTDAEPSAAANTIMASDIEITFGNEMKERYPGNSDISRFAEVEGKEFMEISFSTEIKGSGTAGTAPKHGCLFKACGMGETVVSSTSVTYAPVSSSWGSCTIYLYVDGIRYDVTGCVGDFEVDLTAGEFGKINWTFKGKYEIPTDQSFPSPSFESTIPPVCKGTTTTFGDYTPIIEKLLIKMNNNVAERPDFNESSGIQGFQVTERNPEGSMTLEAVVRSTENADFFSYYDARTSKELSAALGATAGNICTITAPKCYLRGPELGDREGVRTFELPFQLARDSGNDELVIAYT